MKTRSHVQLGSKLEKNLWMYATVASAAGVGLLAITPKAEAKVVYTATNQQVPQDSFIPLDLNGDGAIDFTLVNWQGVNIGGSTRYSSLMACHVKPSGAYACIASWSINAPNAANEVRVVPTGAADLAAGEKIGPGPQWGGEGEGVGMALRRLVPFSSKTYQFWKLPWANDGKGVSSRYLGLKFKIGNYFHYGWARITVQTSTNPKQAFIATLTGYAYETVPGKAIVAGATSDAEEVGVAAPEIGSSVDAGSAPTASLGMLSLGAQGLSIWRREDSGDAI